MSDAIIGRLGANYNLTNPKLAFTCNVCGQGNTVDIQTLQRDAQSCSQCYSSVRFRWIIHSLSKALWGESLLLADFPFAPHIKGIGLSDEPLYSIELADRLGYLNTFYHCEPRLDIKNLTHSSPKALDFVIASEVFEHIPPPVQPAFDNLNSLLKTGGVVLFSTPWRPQGHTVEHFANLHDWKLFNWQDTTVLLNRTKTGALEAFDSLSFHGGEGATLEMRLFSKPSLVANLEAAGFTVEFVDSSFLEYGIVFTDAWSLPCVATKLATASLTQDDSTGVSEGDNGVSQDEVRFLYNELDRITAWADLLHRKSLRLERELNEAKELADAAHKERELVKGSKWMGLGQRLNLGPRL